MKCLKWKSSILLVVAITAGFASATRGQVLELWQPPEQLLTAHKVYLDFAREYPEPADTSKQLDDRKKAIEKISSKVSEGIVTRYWNWELAQDRNQADLVVDFFTRLRITRGLQTTGVFVRSVEEGNIYWIDWEVRLLLPDGKIIRQASASCDMHGCTFMPCCPEGWKLIVRQLDSLGKAIADAKSRSK